MQNLSAQVTSGLLQFPDVTIKALQEDEINLDSVLRGKFTTGKTGLAWLACGPQLEVTNSVTGERLSAYHFSGVTERPPTVVAVKEFTWQKKTGLLVGLVETEGSVLCLYDVGVSRVVKAVVLPGSVTALEPIINHGGASASTQHLHQSLRWFFGVAAVVTNVGHILLIDLCLDDVSSNQDELDASDLEVMSGIPAEIPKLRETATRERRHLCLQLLAPSGTMVSSLSYISRTNHLAVGFSDGYLSLWNMKTLKRDYHVQMEGGRVPVHAVTFQEPENDPRNCCYLWAIQSNQCGGDVSFHLLQLAFSDRKCLPSGQVLYELLEYCEERYSLDLSTNELSLRGQTNSTKLLGCQTIEKFRVHGDREDGVHEVTSPDTSVSVFSWQVNTYGQGKPTIYMGVFDINRWYQAQMPDSLRPGQFLRNCSYFAFWSLEAVVNMMTQDSIFDILVHDRSLSRGVPPSYPPPEQFYFPSTYNFDATCLLSSGIVHITCTGFQKETLHFLKKSGPSLNEAIPDGYKRCLVAGLLSPRLADVQPSSLSQEEQLQAVLSAAVETSSLGLLTSCIKQWTAQEQPRSAANLRFVLEWTWNKVVLTKQEFDRLCVPLFDGTCNFIDPHTLQSLQHCQLRFSNLSTVLNCFITEAQELTKQGLVDLSNKQSVTRLLTQYASVVLWFCHSGLLPDSTDETMQLTRPYYNYQIMHHYYTNQRKKLEHLSRRQWNTSSLMVDGMISQFGDRVEHLWSRDGNGTGKYPPASLHALLDLYLLENADEMSKHAITIYFLLDIMYSFPDKPDSSIESFPTAFSVPCGLIKLIQGFWLLDHNDFQNSVDCMLHPASTKVMNWQHSQIIENLMCHGAHRQALRYIHAIKPPTTTSKEVKLQITVLLANRCIMEAWNLQRLHSSRLNVEELLKHMYETCQEMGLMEDLLKFTFTNSEQDYLHRFLQTSGSVQNQELLLVHHLQRANYIPALQLNQSLKINHVNECNHRLRERAVARNSILDQYGKILPRVQRTLASERAKPYSIPSLVWREVTRPKPLSTVVKQAASGSVMTKAKFISNVLSKIKEVSAASEKREDFSPYKSFVNEEPPTSTAPLDDIDVPDAFVSTPITKSQRVSRLLYSVVHPVLVEPSPLTSTDCEAHRQNPHKSPVLMTSSPIPTSLRKADLRSIAKAPEFGLLQTPLVVRKAKALAASTASSGFTGFTPQSILRSSVRTTPLASPSVSPGRSLTPPLRPKETKISFMEGIDNKYTKGVLASERDLLAASPVLKSSQDIMWSASRGKMDSFTPNAPTVDEEMDESSSGIQEESPHKMEVVKEASNVSARSDQTTLEYHDAPTPEDFEEDAVTVTVNLQPPVIETSVEKEPEAVLFSQTTAAIQPEMKILEPVEKDYEKAEINGVPATGPEKLDTLNEVQDIGTEPVVERVCNASDSNASSPGMLEQESISSDKDSESVISIHDSEDIQSSPSENLEDSIEGGLNGGDEVEILEENVLLVEGQSAITSTSHCVEVQIVEAKEIDILLAEPESEITNYKELYSAGTVELGFAIENIHHHYSSEMVDCRDTAENEMDDIEEQTVQNNFSLILEGDGVEEVEPSISAQPNLTSFETPEVFSTLVRDNADNWKNSKTNPAELAANPLSFLGSNQETKITETLPYVPEPIQVAIAENLLDVIKDTRSKDLTPDNSENEDLKNVKGSQTSSPVEKAKHLNSDINIIRVYELITPPKKSNENSNGGINDPDVSPNESKSVVQPLTPRRSVRKSKFSESANVNSEEILVPTTPKRVSRKAKENPENLEEVSASTRIITRKTKSSVSEKPEPTVMEGLPTGESLTKLPSTPTRTRRGKASKLEDKVNNDNLDQNTAVPLTPTRITRSRNTIPEPERESEPPVEETLTNQNIAVPVTPTRISRSRNTIPEPERESEPPVEETLTNQNIAVPVTPTRISRSRNTMPEPERESEPPVEETLTNQNIAVPVTPTRISRSRNTIPEPERESKPPVEETLTNLPSTPTRARRGKASTSEVNYNMDQSITAPLTPTRSKRSKIVVETEKVVPSQQEESSEREHEVTTPTRGRRSKRVVNELVKHFEQNSSQLDKKADILPVSPKRVSLRWTRNRAENQDNKTAEENLEALDQTVDTSRKRSKKSTNNKMSVVETTVFEGTLSEPVQDSTVTSISTEKASTSIIVRQTRRKALPSVSEEHLEESLQLPQKHEKELDEETRSYRITRTRSNNVNSLLEDPAVAFEFSTPRTRIKKKQKVSVSPKELDLLNTSNFVFSPPSTRTRRATRSGASESLKEKDMKVDESHDAVPAEVTEEKSTRLKGRPAKHKMKTVKKSTEKPSWSPPPVNIQLLSPPESPTDGTAYTKTLSTDAKVSDKNPLRRNRRRMIMSKPVTRRKIR
ncbi:protein ELYS [Rhinophrynus dorsalis]